jgi:hypothetical protein
MNVHIRLWTASTPAMEFATPLIASPPGPSPSQPIVSADSLADAAYAAGDEDSVIFAFISNVSRETSARWGQAQTRPAATSHAAWGAEWDGTSRARDQACHDDSATAPPSMRVGPCIAWARAATAGLADSPRRGLAEGRFSRISWPIRFPRRRPAYDRCDGVPGRLGLFATVRGVSRETIR